MHELLISLVLMGAFLASVAVAGLLGWALVWLHHWLGGWFAFNE